MVWRANVFQFSVIEKYYLKGITLKFFSGTRYVRPRLLFPRKP